MPYGYSHDPQHSVDDSDDSLTVQNTIHTSEEVASDGDDLGRDTVNTEATASCRSLGYLVGIVGPRRRPELIFLQCKRGRGRVLHARQ